MRNVTFECKLDGPVSDVTEYCTFQPRKSTAGVCGHFVWLVWSPETVYYWTIVRHLHYQRSKTCSRHICSLVPMALTNCFQSTSSEHCTAPL